MVKYVVLVLALLLALSVGGVQAQQGSILAQNQNSSGNPIPPAQSRSPAISPCSTGSQSVRVCNDDFRSCGSTCTATALDPTADIAGCSLRCCTQLKACLQIRGCASPTLNCF
jgi:hypothetical protein